MHYFSFILLAGLCLALLYAMWDDLRRRNIPNWLNAGIAIAAPVWWWAQGLPLWPDVAVQIALAVAVLMLFAALFAAGMMGGGDVKLLAALALWFAPFPFLRMLLAMSIIGGVVTIIALIHHRWRKREGKVEVPYGVAISLAAIWLVANELLTIPAA